MTVGTEAEALAGAELGRVLREAVADPAPLCRKQRLRSL